jgi:ethanolaminephosphotransferase
LVSGTVPEFIDILWNFKTTEISQDSLLKQFFENKKRMVFYGDDTWLKLFPQKEYFTRSEGVTSFVASDYTEVICAN